jgi:hypothetical protein
MSTTDHPDGATQPKLKKLAEKLATRTVLAGGLAMAVVGLTAAMANADPAPPNTPGPTPTIAATPHPPAPHGESGLCNQDTSPRGQPLPSNC